MRVWKCNQSHFSMDPKQPPYPPVQIIGNGSDKSALSLSVIRPRFNPRKKLRYAHPRRKTNHKSAKVPDDQMLSKPNTTKTPVNQSGIFLIGLPVERPLPVAACDQDATAEPTRPKIRQLKLRSARAQHHERGQTTKRRVSELHGQRRGYAKRPFLEFGTNSAVKRLNKSEDLGTICPEFTTSLRICSQGYFSKSLKEVVRCVNQNNSLKPARRSGISRRRISSGRSSLQKRSAHRASSKRLRYSGHSSSGGPDRFYRSAGESDYYPNDLTRVDHLDHPNHKGRSSLSSGNQKSLRKNSLVGKLIRFGQLPANSREKDDSRGREGTSLEKKEEENQRHSDEDEEDEDEDETTSLPIKTMFKPKLRRSQSKTDSIEVGQRKATSLVYCLSPSPGRGFLRQSTTIKSRVLKKHIGRLRARKKHRSRLNFKHNQKANSFNTMADKLARVSAIAEKLVEIQSQIKRLPSYGTLGSYYCLADAYLGLLYANLAPQVLKAMLTEENPKVATEHRKSIDEPGFESNHVFSLSPSMMKSFLFERKRKKPKSQSLPNPWFKF